jgi:hypothetical protein
MAGLGLGLAALGACEKATSTTADGDGGPDAASTGGRAGSGGKTSTRGTGGGGGKTSTGGATGAGGATAAGGATGTGSGGMTATGVGGTSGLGGTSGAPAYPLKLAAGQHYLVDQNNRPFLLIGDSPWDLFVTLTTADATTYLEDRRQKGFTSLLIEMIEIKFSPNPPKNAAGDAPFTGTLPGTSTPDFSTPNEAYFAHVDQIITIAAQKGFLLQITPAYLGYQGGSEGWYQQMKANGTTKLAAYGTYIGNRYKSFPNIIWVEGGDTDPTVTDSGSSTGAKIDPTYTRAIANAIKAVDPSHLQTVHGNNGDSVLDAWPGETWIDVSTIYTYPKVVNNVPVYVKALAEYARTGWKPFYLIESTYEADLYVTTPQIARQQAYEALLNGGMGENFGNGVIWPFHSGWQAALNSQGSQDMSRLSGFFSQLSWQTLVPDTANALLTAGLGTGLGHVSAALASDGTLGVFYVPASGTALTVALSKLTGQVTARWFDPTSGAFTAASGSPFPNTGVHVFTPPGNNSAGDADWLLVLQAP